MTLRRTLRAATAAALLFSAAGCGDEDRGADVGAQVAARAVSDAPAAPPELTNTEGDRPGDRMRVIEVVMDEFAFRPERVQVAAGETVEFRFVNTGTEVHDAFVGTIEEQIEHGEEMAHGDGGHGHHTSNDAVTVEPGDSATITKVFDGPAVLEIGCHQPGHYESGMRLALTVT